eukprot:gb/GFBE01017648.1/.p1 GENE.gb/GFBE01017648.1/~~gb/GFBE01017648.1/.p1  ORF type:complete len:165 (+),score=14.43 gb/GFBE01017648.1/:1-495(+)
MARRRETANARCVHGAVGLALLLASLKAFDCPFACQKPLNQERAIAGFGLNVKAVDDEANRVEATKQEQHLIRRITESGRRGYWSEASKIFSNYAGGATSVYNAAITAALRCGKFQEGADIYRRMCNSDIPKTKPTFTVAIKLFANCGVQARCRSFGTKCRMSA